MTEAQGDGIPEWWLTQAKEEIERTLPKMTEYGSGDLEQMGRQLAEIAEWKGISAAEAAELGIYAYVVGKVARWGDALKRRQLCSDDTLFDARVYLGMARLNRYMAPPTQERGR